MCIFACLGESVKKRWSDIRGTFRENHRKILSSQRSGMGSDAVYCPRWPLYTICLSFLELTTRVAEGSSNLTSSTPVSSAEAQSSESMQTTTGHEVYFDDNLQVDVILKKNGYTYPYNYFQGINTQ